jgi:hypothetical protein
MLDNHAETVAVRDTLQPNPPHAVRLAAWVMYTGAVASAIRVVIAFVTADATKTAIRHRYPTLSSSSVTTVTHFAVISGTALSLIAAGLFVWIARMCLDGKDWARITATALCAVAILFAFLGLAYGARSSADQILDFVVAGIGLAATCFLWPRSSNGYFRQSTSPGTCKLAARALQVHR